MMKDRNSSLGCKGNVAIDILTIIGIVVFFAVVAMAFYQPFSEVNDAVQNSDDFSENAKQISDNWATKYPRYFDGLFLFILGLFWIASIAFAVFIDTNPIFFVISVLLLVIVLILTPYISNSVESMFDDDELSSVPASFPIMYFVTTHLLGTMMAIAFTIFGALYFRQ